ncbi:sunset domain-containing protein [Microbacterium sp. PMB16]|uniref:sunset domain-containing protein n=1 Tax=Microbacterium sp. PMB16 TaxID=3120157 RepID=UPI003F4C5B1C
MVFPALSRSARSAAAAVAAAMLASMLVAVATPAAAVSSGPASVAIDPGFAGFADRLPIAVAAAAEIAGQTPEGEVARVSGVITVADELELGQGRSFVVAYAPGADVSSPLAAAGVAADGTYALDAPLGDIVLAVVSEGRSVFDQWGRLGVDLSSAETTSLPAEGLVYDVQLQRSALASGTVTVPAGAVVAGQKVAVVVYPVGGAGEIATAAGFVSDAGTFAVGGIPTGDYRVAFVSVASGAASEWWNDAPTFAKGRTATLTTGTATDVSVALQALLILDTSVPTITGTTTVGQTLKAAPGQWTTGATLTYQWYANGSAIVKATKSSLLLPAAVAGKKITVRVTGAKATYATKAQTSAATAAVLRPLAAPVPVIIGVTTVGQTLKVKTGTWTAGTRLSYQWYIDGVAVAKATGAAYKIPASATRKTITVVVKGTKTGYASASKRSKATAAVKGILSAPVPTIAGSTVVGSRLTARPGTWTAGTTLRYQWYANGKAIKGATASSLVLAAGVVKARITVKVTGSKSGYITAARTSAKSGVVSYPSRTKPSGWNCPAWAPIKGNASSMIYHVPGGRSYKATKPEECFSSGAAAVKAGYRKAKR